MSYFLTDNQEYELNLFLDEENRKVYQEQINSDEIPSDLKDLIRKTEETGNPLPAFDPAYGYYSVSFTPCKDGNRIYVHHHLSNKSKALYDPAILVVNEDAVDNPVESEDSFNTDTTVLYDDLDEINTSTNPLMISRNLEDLNLTEAELMEKFPPPAEVLNGQT